MTHSLYQLALSRGNELIREAADRGLARVAVSTDPAASARFARRRRTTRHFPRFRLASRG